MERREFLGWVGIGLIAVSLPVAIAACTPRDDRNSDNPSSNPSSSNDTPTDPDLEGFMPIGSVTDLNERGFLYNSQTKIMVVRHGATFSALNPICTHSDCPVEWDTTTAMLSCPCHGSKFATDGTVLTGPATESLANYDQVKEVDGIVLVKPI
ncbi:MAG: Rieske (2Fe-2S) protein [Leptolyngbyaceae bacterium]|nr:Rieske (2Fe-2S) protein [Leptolyngbyaceae bacterium]